MLEDHIRWLYTSDFIKTIDYYAKSLNEKILPSFNDNDISAEADRIEEETYNRLASLSSSEWYDPATDVDQARDAGIAFYMMAEGIKQGIINRWLSGHQEVAQLSRARLIGAGSDN